MTNWDGVKDAPKGKFRVIATDTFPWPHEDYWVGDYPDLAQAKEIAALRVQEMEYITIFDENGKRLFIAGGQNG